MTEKLPGLYTIEEITKILGKSERQVWRYVHTQKPPYRLKTHMIGTTYVVTEQDLDDFKKLLEETPLRPGRPKKEK